MNRIILDKRDIAIEYVTDCLLVRCPGEPPRSLPLSRVGQIICLHNVALTTQLIGQLKRRGIDLIVMNQRYHQNSFSIFADDSLSVKRRCIQYELQQTEGHRLPLIHSICGHKFTVIRRMLPEGAHHERASVDHAIQTLREDTLEEDQIRGLEGALQQKVFQFWRSQLPAGLGFLRRTRRPPTDPVNALLSITYVMIHNMAVRQAIASGLDSRLGFYHRVSHGRHSLACDMMEPLRPTAEQWVAQLFLEGQFDNRHFTCSQEGCLLGKSGRQHYYRLLESRVPGWERNLKAGYRWLVRSIDAVETGHER